MESSRITRRTESGANNRLFSASFSPSSKVDGVAPRNSKATTISKATTMTTISKATTKATSMATTTTTTPPPPTTSMATNRAEITIKSARGKKDELRDINNVIFKGVRYSNEYYDDVTSEGAFSRLAYMGDELAGAICCYVLTKGKEAFRRKEVNVSTIGVFSNFRRKGVGTKLMNEVVDAAIADPFVSKIQLNVHINDTYAISFYKRLGFQIINQIQLIQGSAWVMDLTLRKIGEKGLFPK